MCQVLGYSAGGIGTAVRWAEVLIHPIQECLIAHGITVEHVVYQPANGTPQRKEEQHSDDDYCGYDQRVPVALNLVG
jgi:hypothetical protein